VSARLVGAMAVWLVSAIVGAASTQSAVLESASIQPHDGLVELRFGVRGRGLKWHLSAHRQQLWIDLENTHLELPSLEGRAAPPVKGIHTIDPGGGDARVVVEVSGKVDYVVARLPDVLIVRLAPSGAAPDLAAPLLAEVDHARNTRRVPARARRNDSNDLNGHGVPMIPAPNSNAATTLGIGPDRLQTASLSPPNPRSSGPLVVIDPGHGGRDPGTAAADSIAEKDVAIAIAQRLASALSSRGFETLLTRTDDTFLSLADRMAVANRAHADLFISVHLNSSPDPGTAGIETYYLNNTTDRATIRLARMENGVAGGYSAPGQADLNYILSDLRQGYKANESASLARMIEAETAANIAASQGLRVHTLGAKKGPFYVLVGAEMPAVLVECGFLSNAAEAQELTAPGYQQSLADGIADAVVHYYNADAAVGNL
jgi:N-acetylmuramoyl-L-alanine amidase